MCTLAISFSADRVSRTRKSYVNILAKIILSSIPPPKSSSFLHHFFIVSISRTCIICPMIKRFMEWIRLKSRLHDLPNASIPLFKEGEVWWCGIGDNVGSEINGKSSNFTRPVLIFKKFSGELFSGLPMTTKIKSGTLYVNISFKLKTQGVVLNQGRTLNARRLYTLIGQCDEEDMKKVKAGFGRLFLDISPQEEEVVGNPQRCQ